MYLSKAVLPETLRRGPYAVVERAERAKPPSSLVEIKLNYYGVFCYFLALVYREMQCYVLRGILLLFGPLYKGKCSVMYCGVFCYFLDPSIYVVTLYEIVGGG